MSVVLVGDSAVSHFQRGDGAALHADAATLGVLNVIEPGKAPFARGASAVLEGRLADADTEFSRALADGQTCAVRVNLELVRETQGDVAAAAGRTAAAGERYRSALSLVTGAPAGCFAGNDDPQPDRRTVRADAEARLNAKIAGLQAAPPPPEANTALPPPPPPPPPAGVAPAESDMPPPALGPSGQGLSDISPDRLPSPGAAPSPPHQLGGGDPLDRLRQLLTDAASSGSDAG
ncbi:hypothetical protein ACQ86B_10500 [Mycolicibacterium aichiense]|uniref:hypothetical protein n=1 Tax=Mycolicibacterium aichiense TaxID=1799 RepID=UPI003D673AFB